MQFVAELPLLEVNEEIAAIVREYLQYRIRLNGPPGDALHLALT